MNATTLIFQHHFTDSRKLILYLTFPSMKNANLYLSRCRWYHRALPQKLPCMVTLAYIPTVEMLIAIITTITIIITTIMLQATLLIRTVPQRLAQQASSNRLTAVRHRHNLKRASAVRVPPVHYPKTLVRAACPVPLAPPRRSTFPARCAASKTPPPLSLFLTPFCHSVFVN